MKNFSLPFLRLSSLIKAADLNLYAEKNNIKGVGFSAIKEEMVTASRR